MNVKITSEINKIKVVHSSDLNCNYRELNVIQIVSEHLIERILFSHIVIAPEQMATSI